MKHKKSGTGRSLTATAGTATKQAKTARYLFNYTMLNTTAQDTALYITACLLPCRCTTERHRARKAG